MSTDRELMLTRLIDAPREKLYRAWTDPTLLKQWFAPLPYTTPVAEGLRKLSLYSGEHAVGWSELLGKLRHAFAETHEIATHGNQAVLTTATDADQVVSWLKRHAPGVAVLSVGQSIDLYKDVGAPADIARRYRFRELQGTHLVGHTRMATESAVTPDMLGP